MALEEVTCNLCGRDHYQVVYKDMAPPQNGRAAYTITDPSARKPGRIVKCLGCALIYASPRKSEGELVSAYCTMVDDEYVREEKGRRLSAHIILRRLTKLNKRGRILDIGCATGFLLDEAKRKNWEAYGIELSAWGASYAREKFGLQVFCGPLEQAGFTRNFFDVVVLQDAIEHLADPRGTLIGIRRILKPDGIICITTPDINSLISKALRARWWGINEAHLFYFTKRTLHKMLDATGFVPVKWRAHPRTFSFRYWALRLRDYNAMIYGVLKFISEKTFVGHRLLTVNTADQIEVYARKSRRLEYIEELEWEPDTTSQKKHVKTVVVLPAYNAAATLKKTVEDIPRDVVDEIILVDDTSRDDTVAVAKGLGLKVFVHDRNRGYGGNQKTCYQKALELGADIVVMVHPDYQYDPKAIPDLIDPIKQGRADAVFGSRMMKGGSLTGGMPLWKHNANILLTAAENVIFGTYLTEYHSGFRAYSARALRAVRFADNSDGFIFDTEIIAQLLLHYCTIEEVPIRTRYFDEASTIKLLPSVIYGFGILKTLIKFMLHTRTFITFQQFE